MPWYFAAAALPLTGVRLGYCNLFGIGAALLFDALLGLPLPASAKEQRNQAGPTLNPYPSTLTPYPLTLLFTVFSLWWLSKALESPSDRRGWGVWGLYLGIQLRAPSFWCVY